MLASKWAPKPTEAEAAPSAKNATTVTAATSAIQAATNVETETQHPNLTLSETLPTENDAVPAANMPHDYYADDSIDPFAQTAGTDDLFFDDDFTPVPEPVIEQNPIDAQVSEPPEGHAPPDIAQPQSTPRAPANVERGGRGRGRGRGGRGRGRGGQNAESREKREEKDKEKEKDKDAKGEESSTPKIENEDSATDGPATPLAPKEPKPPTSVRGDRTLTGGPKRSRLTEEELNAKLASMRSKNEALAAAHARAENDLANFEAREALAVKQNAEKKKQAAERQKQDRQNRQQMMGERERNRIRKLEALKGREWDVEKEDGFAGTGEERRRGAARGAHGGVAPSPRPSASAGESFGDSPDQETPSTPSHRGRGRGRGARGGRGGRGDHSGGNQPTNTKQEDQKPPAASDFPELPHSASTTRKDADEAPKKLDFPIKTKTSELKAADTERPGIKKQESFGLPSPMGAGKSWADQVEGS